MGSRKRKSTPRTRRGLNKQRRPPAKPPLPDMARLRQVPQPPWWSCFILPVVVFVATSVTFLPALDAEFVNWDDDKAIVNNPHIRGLTSENIRWMFTESKMGHYHPLTWLSYAVDHAIGAWRFESLPDTAQARYERGLDPRIFHLTNLLLHAATAVAFYFLARLLLCLVLPPPDDRPDEATPVAAALAALLFACHPLRVENAVWVTERRDVLSAVLLLVCLYCYLKYALTERRGAMKVALYVGSVVLLLLSLLSKAWGITLPAILLVLDVHPLKRLGGRAGWSNQRALLAYLDKIPLVGLAGYFAWRAKEAQGEQLDTLKSLAEWGYADRVAQAFYGLFFYSYKTLIPLELTALVPLPVSNNPLAWRYVGAAAVTLAVATLILLMRKRWPGGVVLAICYAVTLSPVLGFAQSGPQLVADKYAYLACLTWALLGGAGLLLLLRHRRTIPWARRASPVGAALAVVVCATYAELAWRQTLVWHDSRSLWTHAIQVDPRCVMARTNLGLLERQAGNVAEAIKHYKAALEVDPNDAILVNNLAVAVREDPQRQEESIELSRRAVALQPKLPDLHFTLAESLRKAGRLEEALVELKKCTRLKSRQPKYHRAMGKIFIARKQYKEAEERYKLVLQFELQLDPRGKFVIDALERLGRIMLAQGRSNEAAAYFERILALDPDNQWAQRGLTRARGQKP